MVEKNCPECKEGKLVRVVKQDKFSQEEYFNNIAQQGMFIATANAITPKAKEYYQCNNCRYEE